MVAQWVVESKCSESVEAGQEFRLIGCSFGTFHILVLNPGREAFRVLEISMGCIIQCPGYRTQQDFAWFVLYVLHLERGVGIPSLLAELEE